MEVQVIYNNTRTGEHQHYGSTLAEVAESFNGEWDEIADDEDLIEIGVILERVIGFDTTKVRRIEYSEPLDIPGLSSFRLISDNAITFQTEDGVESCPHCKKEVKK